MAIGSHGKSGSTVMFHVVGALRLGKGCVLSLFMEVKPAQDQVKTRETATLILVQVRSSFDVMMRPRNPHLPLCFKQE